MLFDMRGIVAKPTRQRLSLCLARPQVCSSNKRAQVYGRRGLQSGASWFNEPWRTPRCRHQSSTIHHGVKSNASGSGAKSSANWNLLSCSSFHVEMNCSNSKSSQSVGCISPEIFLSNETLNLSRAFRKSAKTHCNGGAYTCHKRNYYLSNRHVRACSAWNSNALKNWHLLHFFCNKSEENAN